MYTVVWTPDALDALRRVIQNRLQNVLASEILSGRFPKGSTIRVDCQNGEFTLAKA
jgi:ATP-dependent Clp protease ATP-binding subunit ClpA